MSSKINISGLDDIKRRLEQTYKIVDDKHGTRVDPAKVKTFIRGGAYLHTGENEKKSAQFERDFPAEFAYWRKFFQDIGDNW